MIKTADSTKVIKDKLEVGKKYLLFLYENKPWIYGVKSKTGKR